MSKVTDRRRRGREEGMRAVEGESERKSDKEGQKSSCKGSKKKRNRSA